MNVINKIGLGTVQWGMAYGINNRSGQPKNSEICQMLFHARGEGVAILDTAHVYGKAEIILGQQGAISKGFDVVTKILPIDSKIISKKHIEQLSQAFFDSLKKLKSEQVYGLLVHSAGNLLSPGGDLIWEKLQEFKAKQRVMKIGVSVYHPQQLDDIMGRYEIDIVQLPYNIYDQRFAQTGLLEKLQMGGIETHARSVFLQGLIFMNPENMPDYFSSIRIRQSKLHNELSKSGLTPLEGCLSYCFNQPYIDKIIVGCETLGQLKQVIRIAEKSPSSLPDLEPYSINDEKLIDPSKWPQ